MLPQKPALSSVTAKPVRMKIELQRAGKRYNREWIFKDVHLSLQSSTSYAITGPNGSGKSTLLQLIAGATLPSAGKVIYTTDDGKNIAADNVFLHIAFAAPYLELVEEMTLHEALNFHQQFKPFFAGITNETIAATVGLEKALNKEIRNFSSGMKQRVRLAQAFFSHTEVLLLDEPTSNLDAAGIALYHSLVQQYTKGRLLIIASNDVAEYHFCETVVPVQSFGTNT